MILFYGRKFNRYEVQSVFDPEVFIEVPEQYFDDTVVKFRQFYQIKYFNEYQEFIEKETGLKIRRYYI